MYKKTALLLLLTAKAIASPTIYPTNITYLSQLQNSTTSNLIADTVDHRKVYVMPPSVAIAKVGGLHTLTANLGFCREMADDQKYSSEIAKRIKEIGVEELEARKEVAEARKKWFAAKEEAAKFAVQAKMLDLTDLDNEITKTETRLDKLYTDANACSGVACDKIYQELDDVSKHKTELLKQRRVLVKVHTADMRTYEKHKVLVNNLKENLDELQQVYVKINARLSQIKSDFLAMYSSFGQMEGARASISFRSDWDQNVATLRAENPGIEFVKIQTQKAQVLTSITLPQVPGAQAILAYEVGGQNNKGVLYLPSYPESMSGNVVLSLVGACPALHPDWFEIPTEQNTGSEAMKYGLTVSYEYPSVFSVNATARYNMYKMYQKIVETGSSGGLFDSSSWSNVHEKNLFQDSFSVKWDEQDPSVALPQEEKDKIEAEMRKNIFDRIAMLAIPQTPDRNGIIMATGAPKNGALVLSEGLMTACPGNAYCVGGSIALNVLNAIFGHSSNSSSYLQTYDVFSSESFSRSKVHFKPAITSYN